MLSWRKPKLASSQGKNLSTPDSYIREPSPLPLTHTNNLSCPLPVRPLLALYKHTVTPYFSCSRHESPQLVARLTRYINRIQKKKKKKKKVHQTLRIVHATDFSLSDSHSEIYQGSGTETRACNAQRRLGSAGFRPEAGMPEHLL